MIVAADLAPVSLTTNDGHEDHGCLRRPCEPSVTLKQVLVPSFGVDRLLPPMSHRTADPRPCQFMPEPALRRERTEAGIRFRGLGKITRRLRPVAQ